MIFQEIVNFNAGQRYIKKSSNRGAILIRRNLDCQKEFKFDLETIGLLNSVEIGFG